VTGPATAAHVISAEAGGTHFTVHIGDGRLEHLGPLWAERAAGDQALVVFDANTAPHAEAAAASLRDAGLRTHMAEVPPGERSKSLTELERLCREAARAGIRRADAVVAVGGGVVGDLAGFLAASYQRGVRLVHVPTTLLAMVDSSIGGKTGVDLPEGKNYVGAIWQPQLVVMDTATLGTLPARELSCGFAEVVKYGLLDSIELFERVEAWPAPLPGPGGPLLDLIRDCVRHKVEVVTQDERETGLRASLNLGHTVGHGIEAAAGYERYHHGEAISLGMLAALRVAEHARRLDPSWRDRTRAVLERHGLPTRLDPEVRTPDILAAMGRDKKADATALNMVLLDEPGVVLLRQDPPHDVVVAAIEELRA